MSAKTLAIDLIRCGGGTQMRAELSVEVYMDYRDKVLAGVEFPPLDVFFDGSDYWLADGFHRFYGHREAKKASVKCNVHNGTVRDAILFAVGANQSHGLRRTQKDKRNAVELMLNDPEWVKWSDRKIAQQAGVGNQLVSECRKQLCESHSTPAAMAKDEPKIGLDGKSRKPKPQASVAGNAKAAAPQKIAVDAPSTRTEEVEFFEPDIPATSPEEFALESKKQDDFANETLSKLKEHLRQAILLADKFHGDTDRRFSQEHQGCIDTIDDVFRQLNSWANKAQS